MQPTWLSIVGRESGKKNVQAHPLCALYHLQMTFTGQTHVEAKLLMSKGVNLTEYGAG